MKNEALNVSSTYERAPKGKQSIAEVAGTSNIRIAITYETSISVLLRQ